MKRLTSEEMVPFYISGLRQELTRSTTAFLLMRRVGCFVADEDERIQFQLRRMGRALKARDVETASRIHHGAFARLTKFEKKWSCKRALKKNGSRDDVRMLLHDPMWKS